MLKLFIWSTIIALLGIFLLKTAFLKEDAIGGGVMSNILRGILAISVGSWVAAIFTIIIRGIIFLARN